MKITIWGEGGFDASKPNNNIVQQIEVDDPPTDNKEQARQSALTKLRNLGLTDDEIQALVG
jgi:hypothetical protein